MNAEEKTAWIDEENKIVSFHAIDNANGHESRKPVLGLSIRTDKFRIPGHVKGGSIWHEKNPRIASGGSAVSVAGSVQQKA